MPFSLSPLAPSSVCLSVCLSLLSVPPSFGFYLSLEVLRGKGPEFSSSERGSKPSANENAKPNRLTALVSDDCACVFMSVCVCVYVFGEGWDGWGCWGWGDGLQPWQISVCVSLGRQRAVVHLF